MSLLDPSGVLQDPLQTTMIDGPRHGQLIQSSEYPGSYVFHPEKGYLGPDQMTFEVDVKGKKLKVIYSVVVDQLPGDQVYKDPDLNKLCPDGFQIKELPKTGDKEKGSSLDILELPTDSYVPPEHLEELHAAISAVGWAEPAKPNILVLPKRHVVGLHFIQPNLPPSPQPSPASGRGGEENISSMAGLKADLLWLQYRA
jgi:hypothetical protein